MANVTIMIIAVRDLFAVSTVAMLFAAVADAPAAEVVADGDGDLRKC